MSSDIEIAIQSAKYNEAVVVTLLDPTEQTGEIVLTAQLDEVNGGIVWNQVKGSDHDNDNDDDIAIVQHLRTKRWVLPMLNDKPRNSLYDKAIQKACQEALKRFRESNRTCSSNAILQTIDIGSGTGLLAMMTAHHMQQEIQRMSNIDGDVQNDINNNNSNSNNSTVPTLQVTSVEMSSAMARLARQTIASNDLQHHINVVEATSYDVELDVKALLCTSELLESGLLGEGVLPALRDAWQRLLHPNAVMVPQRARVYAQVLEGRECIGKYWGRHSCETENGLRLCLSADIDDVMIGEKHDGIMIPVHVEKLFPPTKRDGDDDLQGDDESIMYARKLCDPVEVLAFDFSRGNIPEISGHCQTTSFVPTTNGVAHGVLFWWELDLWDGLTYSTECGKQEWQDHWHQCLYVFPIPDAKCPRLVAGEMSNLVVRHDSSRISFQIETLQEDPKKSLKRQRSETVAPAISPQRAFQLNDINRTAVLRSSVIFALQEKGRNSVVLDLSDFALCAMLAALEGALQVVSLESSTRNLAQTAARVAQLANGLPRTGASFQVLQCYPEHLTLDTVPGTDHKPIEIVVAEPYYEILEGWHLQEAMNFYFLVRSLRSRGVISQTASIVPAYASVKGAAISCATLQRAYSKCGDGDDSEDDASTARLCGFKHDLVNSYGARFDKHDLCLPCWQYDITKLTDDFELGLLHFEDVKDSSGNEQQVSVPFSKAGTCHGILCWIEYGLRISRGSDDSCYRCITTEDRRHHQIIRLLPTPVNIVASNLASAKFECKGGLRGLAGIERHKFQFDVVLRSYT